MRPIVFVLVCVAASLVGCSGEKDEHVGCGEGTTLEGEVCVPLNEDLDADADA